MKPFRDGDMYSITEGHLKRFVDEIRNLEADYVRKTPREKLVEYYSAEAMIEPLILRAGDKYIVEHSNTNLDVSHDIRRSFPGEQAIIRGSKLTIAIPFAGDQTLWKVRASTFSMSGYPDLNITKGEIRFSLSFPDDEANSDRLKREIDRIVESLSSAVANQLNDVDKHNQRVPAAIEQAVDRRLENANVTTQAIESLGIPMKRSEKPAYAIPTKRRARPTRPKATGSTQKSEPFLDASEYQFILSVTRRMSLVIERNPKTFAGLDEEAIRDHFLLHLNGHYEGMATGETFNSNGKTDILIRENDRNVFIAECKFWTGKKGFGAAIDQLLSYLSWRDCKCALLIFNRNKNSMDVWNKMHEVMEARPEYVKTVHHSTPDADSHYVFKKQSDEGREIEIATQVFDIPTDET